MEVTDKFPERFTINSAQLLNFALNGQAPLFSEEWVEIAEYKLVGIRRVRYRKEWENEG